MINPFKSVSPQKTAYIRPKMWFVNAPLGSFGVDSPSCCKSLQQSLNTLKVPTDPGVCVREVMTLGKVQFNFLPCPDV